MPLQPDYRNPAEDVSHAKASWMRLAVPPVVSYVCWPISLLLLGFAGVLAALIIVILCLPWGWSISKRVAARYHISSSDVAIIELGLILSSIPVIIVTARILNSM